MVHVAGIVTSQELHGGRAVEHCLEMQKIARIVFEKEKEKLMYEIKQWILEAQQQAYEQALQDVMRVLEYDIESVTKIGIEGCRDIFEDQKAQKFISDHVIKAIQKELQNKRFQP